MAGWSARTSARLSAFGERAEHDLVQTTVGTPLRQRLREGRSIDEVLRSCGPHDEHGPAVDPVSEEGEEPGAHGVRPVQVLEDQDRRLLRHQRPHQRQQRLEEQRGRRVRRGAGVATLAQLGKEGGQLDPDALDEALGERGPEDRAVAAQGFDPGPERQGPLGLVAAAERHPERTHGLTRRELLDQPALPDPGLAGDQHDVPAVVEHARDRARQAVQLGLPTDHAGLHGPSAGGQRPRGMRTR